jgi:serine/threonine protein kinase
MPAKAAAATTVSSTIAVRRLPDSTDGASIGTPLACEHDLAEAMSASDAHWITTTPEARLTSGPEKVSVRDSLAPGTVLLEEFEILRVLGTGGFGIVYLARDHLLQRDVAIKEYLPAVLSRRGEGAAVTMRANTAGCAETFAKGLESFLGEARLLASFDHPALVKVHRFWRDNGTAYMAMPYYPGQTLKDVRLHMLAVPPEPWLAGLVWPLLGALELLHRQGVFHRDIAPDNILILPDGRPVLLDFGSARRAVASGSQWFTAHLKPQFAPLEQYAEDESLGQGPWTDLYSLGATLYFVVSGRAPVASVVRSVRDTLPALSTAPAVSLPGLSPRLLGTIDWTLALSPHDRPQDVAAVQRALRGEIAPPSPSPRFAADAGPAAAVDLPAPTTLPEQLEPSKGQLVTSAPVRPRPRPRPGAALLLAFAGLATMGYGAFALSGGAPAVTSAALPAVVDVPDVIEAKTAPAAAEMPSPPPALVPTIAPVAALSPASEPDPERRSEGLETTRPMRPVAAAGVEREPKAARARKRSPAPRSAKAAARDERAVCTADAGMLTTALCVLNPCRDPKGRSAQCVDRQRAEEARLRRIALAY